MRPATGYAMLALVLTAGPALGAPAAALLTSFQLSPYTGGVFPAAGLIGDSSGALYGTTMQGGVYDGGTVFMLTPPAAGAALWTQTKLHDFAAFNSYTDGSFPQARLLRGPQGVLYGTTSQGGPSGKGTVFALIPPAGGRTQWAEQVLYAFTGPDGATPAGGVAMDASGALYGATQSGGSDGSDCGTSGCGVIYQLTPPAAGQTVWTETLVHAFIGGSDGSGPRGDLLIDSAGVLYGTDLGGPHSNGHVDRFIPPAPSGTSWTRTILYDVTPLGLYGLNGALIMDSKGALYGTADSGGISNHSTCSSGCGGVYKVTPPAPGHAAWTGSTLFDFPGSFADGAEPNAGVILDRAGDLLGAAIFGGSNCSPGSGGTGVVFKLTPPAGGQGLWTETVPHMNTCAYGSIPQGPLLLGPNQTVYGVMQLQGPLDGGTVYQVGE